MADNWAGQHDDDLSPKSRHRNGYPETSSSSSSSAHTNPSPRTQSASTPRPHITARRTCHSPLAVSRRTSSISHRARKGKRASVRFTTDPENGIADDWEPDVEEQANLDDVDLGPPQVPPVAHVYTPNPKRPANTGAAPEYAPEPGTGTGAGVVAVGYRQEQPRTMGKAIQTAYEKAQNFASRLRRSGYSGKGKDEGVSEKRASNPDGEAAISMVDNENDAEMGNAGYTGEGGRENERERRCTLRAQEANELVERMNSTVNQPRWSASYSEDTTPGDTGPAADYFSQNNNQNGGHRRSILGDLLMLQNNAEEDYRRRSSARGSGYNGFRSPSYSTRPSGRSTPRTRKKWWEKPKHQHRSSSGSVGTMGSDETLRSSQTELKKPKSGGMLANAVKRLRPKAPMDDEIRITVHIAETISRQRYLEKLCEALMAYGAPTHRLEECMRMTSKVLDLDSQFLYLPGCMFVSFDDPMTHTSDLRMRRYVQGVDLGRLEDVHQIYKEVIHDQIGVDEAIRYLEELMERKPRYNILLLIFLFGCASAAVGPFAFTARGIDLPISFALGCLLGVLKYVAVPRSRLYANIFELTAALLTSFLARAFGSISHNGGHLFCFPALAQSSIALILPGFMVLCSSLELQSQNILAGSVRLVYAIIYSLVLGFGIMLGTSFYGRMDGHASSDYICPVRPDRNVYAHNFPSVIAFTICVSLINYAKISQLPAMVTISFIAYIVNFFSQRVFPSNIQIANAMGAFVIGVMGNLYSRIGRGLAAAAMLPAIFVQVPSGIAASGSLVSGLAFANEDTHNTSNTAVVNDTNSEIVNAITSAGVSGFGQDLANRIGSSKVYGDIVFDLAYAMVQVSISTTVGLFLAALVIYPEGKRRSELFSF